MLPTFVLTLLLLSTLNSQAPSAPAPLSALPPDFRFDGAWTCEGTFRNGKPHHAAFEGAVTVGGKWLQLQERDVEPATGYIATYLIGYDAQAHGLVEFDANNFSAAVYRSSAGWQNGTVTLTSTAAAGAKSPYLEDRFTYTIQAADGFTVDWQIHRAADQPWVTADHLACKRPPA